MFRTDGSAVAWEGTDDRFWDVAAEALVAAACEADPVCYAR